MFTVSCLFPPALAVAEALRVIKSNSSLWVHQTAHRAAFAWQEGYNAFSVSQSNVPAVVKYIRNQEQHSTTAGFPFRRNLSPS
jgi:putative transposase